MRSGIDMGAFPPGEAPSFLAELVCGKVVAQPLNRNFWNIGSIKRVTIPFLTAVGFFVA